jgi:hypothetical protein
MTLNTGFAEDIPRLLGEGLPECSGLGAMKGFDEGSEAKK